MAYSSSGNNIFKEVASKASIKDVIGFELGASKVIKKGKDYVCICPFHNDHSPSMQISTSRNTYMCWVCHKGGDAISFVQEYEKISPLEALKKVCSIASIPVPEEISHKKEYVSPLETNFKEELSALLELKKFYQVYLNSKEGEEARAYLEKRKIPKDAITHFELGYAPKDPELAIKALRKQGYTVKTLERAGILAPGGDFKDRYSERLMYPIFDDWGHLVGFSGRKIREDQTGGKYINYPATELFNKSQILYHYSMAKTVAKKYGYIYVVEGFNDVIAFQRAGIESCVGSMGTALTEENIQSLKRLGVEVRLCLDKDEPGQKAEEECLPLLLKAEVPFRVVRPFKGGKDADEVLANFYPNGNEELNKEALLMYDPFLFLLARALRTSGNTKKLTDSLLIQQFIKKSTPYYLALDQISQTNNLKTLAKVTDLELSVLESFYHGSKVETPVEVVPEEIKIEEPKKVGKKPYDPNRYGYRRYPSQPQPDRNMIVSQNLAPKYKVCDNIIDFIRMAQNSPKGQALLGDLVKNETQIIFVLPHSREASDLFLSYRCDIVFSPFYSLAVMISQIYQHDKNLKSFSENEYDLMRRLIKQSDSRKKSDSEDAFDMEGLDHEDEGFDTSDEVVLDIPVPEEDKEFLLYAIDFISRSGDEIYGKEELIQQLKYHPWLQKYDERVKDLRLQGLFVNTDKVLLEVKKQLKLLNYPSIRLK